MNLLFDSHALYWWMTEDDRLPLRVHAGVLAGEHTVSVSAASVWELEIKRSVGRLELVEDVAGDLAAAGFWSLAITFEHAVAAARLPLHHRDPFDRMLVAQARLEGLTLVTGDARMRRYDVPVLWD